MGSGNSRGWTIFIGDSLRASVYCTTNFLEILVSFSVIALYGYNFNYNFQFIYLRDLYRVFFLLSAQYIINIQGYLNKDYIYKYKVKVYLNFFNMRMDCLKLI